MKRTAWILLAAAAAVGGLFLLADMLGNGIFLEFLSEQLFYMQEYTDTTGVLHQYLSPDWSRIKLLLFLLTMLTVGGCIIIVRLQVRKAAFQHKEDMQKAVEKALHQFLEECDFYLPEGYGGIEALLLQIRAKEQKQLDLLEKQTRQKHDLISYLAHDMKTPLASVIGYLNLLNDVKDIPQPQKEAYLRITLDKADRLEGLIDEFFDITRFNLHDIVISRGKLQLDFLLEQLKEQFYPILRAQHKQLHLDIAEGAVCYGDADKLARAFNNILKNAISYSYPNTEIHVQVTCDETNTVLKFLNQGDEIPKQKLDIIFEKFYRLDQARSTASGGAGLGLAIAKEIIEAHDGHIYAQSNLQETVFIVELPLHPSVEEHTAVQS